jgi:carbon storage regulator
MLVLSRKPLQSIMIGPDIKITVVKVERNQVRIGIEAPRELTILRDELVESGGAVNRTHHEPLVEIEVASA